MLGKPDVQQHQIEVRPFAEHVERLGAVTSRFDLVTGLLEQLRQDMPKSTVIVNQQNAAIGGLGH